MEPISMTSQSHDKRNSACHRVFLTAHCLALRCDIRSFSFPARCAMDSNTWTNNRLHKSMAPQFQDKSNSACHRAFLTAHCLTLRCGIRFFIFPARCAMDSNT
ncbi:hypothetical protein AVEN_178274-1 [Araneus ventricosus]|uniref:Uncharacterized protein n=1 Tax=Araneus ventricosus TaxID=182803 RepID=A0A4Y2V3I9_ARAVE|nr:hypothetical protein AVEN_178274-1 [Araneus ventricosus]